MSASETRGRASGRRVLAGLGAAVTAGLAGCDIRGTDSTPEQLEFDRLDATNVDVDDGVDLSVPAGVSTVDAMMDAELLVLPGGAAVDVEQVAGWLADGKVIGLLGPRVEATWID